MTKNTILSVTGIYDGKNIYPVLPIQENRKFKVLITFLEEIDNQDIEANLRNFGTTNPSLEFWNNTSEDIYQDYLPAAKIPQ